MKTILPGFLAVFLCACTPHKSNLDADVKTSSFLESKKQDVVACLGKPNRNIQLTEKEYLSYPGDNKCTVTFIIKKGIVDDILYTTDNGRQLDPGQCHVSNRNCNS